MVFRNKLVQLRKAAGLSQDDLADKLNITRQAVYKWETGASMPDIDNLKRLSVIFNVSLDILLDDNVDIRFPPASSCSYGSVYCSGITPQDVDVEADNTRYTDIENSLLKRKKILKIICFTIAATGVILVICSFISFNIWTLCGGLAAALFALLVELMIDKYLYCDIYINKSYFFDKKGQSEKIFKEKGYWYVQLQDDLLAWFFFDEQNRTFGFYFKDKEQFICPVKNYFSFSCSSSGQGITQGNNRLSAGIVTGGIHGVSVSGSPSYVNQGDTNFLFSLQYFDESGHACEYKYSLMCYRAYTLMVAGYDQNAVAGLRNICSEFTKQAFTKIHDKLEIEKSCV